MRSLFFILALYFFSLPQALAQMAEGCDSNPALQSKKSVELIKIAQEDQADRTLPYDSIHWDQVNPRDLQRRIRVAEIIAENCLKTASDYAFAAIVFQHGTGADHFYQTFLWANKAVSLGDESQRWLSAAGLDRYLVKMGHKQLFGTQFGRNKAGAWCIQPVESTFPDSRRREYMKLSLKKSIANTLKGLGSSQSSYRIKDCEPALKESPKGSVPGFW